MKKRKRKKIIKNLFIKKLGLKPTAERTPKVLRERIKILKNNIKNEKYSGKLAIRAEYYLSEHQRKLREA